MIQSPLVQSLNIWPVETGHGTPGEKTPTGASVPRNGRQPRMMTPNDDEKDRRLPSITCPRREVPCFGSTKRGLLAVRQDAVPFHGQQQGGRGLSCPQSTESIHRQTVDEHGFSRLIASLPVRRNWSTPHLTVIRTVDETKERPPGCPRLGDMCESGARPCKIRQKQANSSGLLAPNGEDGTDWET